ncbi:hypothetical protein [Microbacterium sp. T2.11-28]|uniref:hypothetical protein n=1 Tax=Microbacterium sp. T2.11-28 TaxID=3041169 RepID=UPI0025412324|nr:hypothetical protein [Microbacterium sp. T2.11-28]
MSTRPVRRHSPAVYRRRRLAVLLLVVLVIGAAVALALWRPWEGSAAAAPSPSSSGTAASPDASPSASAGAPATPSGTPSAAASPSPSASTMPVCSSGDVTVSAVTDRDSYSAGAEPQLSIRMENGGDTACAINVGTAAQSFTISSGTDVWWRSTDCQTEPSDQIVQLDPGQTVSSVEPLVWDRTRSSVSTCDDDRPRALAGYYNLVVSVGGIDSEPTQFRLR